MNFIASDGGVKTIDHLLKAEDNETTEVRGFGVTGSDLYDMVDGLHAMHFGVRSRRPFAHISCPRRLNMTKQVRPTLGTSSNRNSILSVRHS